MNIEELKNNMSYINNKIEQNKIVDEVLLVGATKTRTIETIEAATRLGLLVAGENRVQELLAKYKKVEGLTWHFIGALQTNKVKYIVDKVDMIHSVDRIELANEINRRCEKINKVMPVLIEINIGREESKSGVKPEDLIFLIEQVKQLPFVKVVGLMSVLPKFAEESLYKAMADLFLSVKNKFRDLDLRWLSMGMSDDYEIALKNGANLIRIGTLLFGKRDYLN